MGPDYYVRPQNVNERHSLQSYMANKEWPSILGAKGKRQNFSLYMP